MHLAVLVLRPTAAARSYFPAVSPSHVLIGEYRCRHQVAPCFRNRRWRIHGRRPRARQLLVCEIDPFVIGEKDAAIALLE